MTDRAAPSRRSAVIFDVDGTLCDVSSVRHHVATRPKNFDAFHAASIDCPARPDVLDGVTAARKAGHAVLVVTARRFQWRYHTILWLSENGVDYDELYMRADDDHRRDVEVKRDVLRRIRRDGYEPVLAWDDNPNVIQLWETEGIPVRLVPGWEVAG